MADIEMVEATFPVARVADSARGYPRDSNNIMEVQAGSGIRNSGSDDIASSSAKAGPETAKKDATSSSTVELQADSDVTPDINSLKLQQRLLNLVSKNIFRTRRHTVNDDRYSRIVLEKLEDHKMGYPQLAALINSDVNFLMYRRFGYLRNRVLLHKQDELAMLEQQLKELDDLDDEEDHFRIRSRKYDSRHGVSARERLIGEINDKLKEYDDLLLREKSLKVIDPPTSRNHRSLFDWIWNEKPLVEAETSFIYQKGDFISLASGEEDSLFYGFIEDCLKIFPSKRLQQLFTSASKRALTTNDLIHYYSKEHLGILVRVVVIVVTTALVMIPVSLLFTLKTSDMLRLVIVLVFTLVFPTMIAAFTRAKNHEVFAIVAAYCAVLVVFLGNLSFH